MDSVETELVTYRFMKMKKKHRVLFEVGLIVVFIIKIFFMDFMKVSGDSMMDFLYDGDIVMIDKIQNTYERNDIIVSYYQFGIFKKNIIKRIIGLPNEKIQIKDGNVYINDEVLENDINIYIEDAGIASNPIVLKDNEYFVLGDNRNNSNDSRNEEIGIIKENQIVGIVNRIIKKE